MLLTDLNAISPIDGRYRSKTKSLANYFSEQALIKYRVMVEIEYFISLCKIPLKQLSNIDISFFRDLRKIHENFNSEDAREIKNIEKTTNHDVKAVEYFLKKEFDKLGLENYKEFPLGLNTPLAYGGYNFPSEFRELLMIVRSIMSKPNVWIADDSLYAVNVECIQKIRTYLGNESIIILVSNRKELIEYSTRKYKLNLQQV